MCKLSFNQLYTEVDKIYNRTDLNMHDQINLVEAMIEACGWGIDEFNFHEIE